MEGFAFRRARAPRVLGSLVAAATLAVALLVAPVPVVYAAPITVESTGDGPATAAHCPGPTCTLRDAIAAASTGQTIIFSVTLPATITLTNGQLDISKTLTINGPGSNLLFIDGNNASRVININLSVGVAISGTTIQHGSDTSGGGIFVVNGFLTLTNSSLVSNTASSGGGGIYANGAVAILNSLIYSNSAATGAGIQNYNLLTLSNSWVFGNSPGAGVLTNYSFTMTNSTVRGNAGRGISNAFGAATILSSTVSGNSGGILNSDAMTITNSTISGNHSTGNGGGVLTSLTSTLTLNNVTVANNLADSFGGGIVANGAAATIHFKNTIVARNSSPAGNPDCRTLSGGTINSLDYNLIQDTSGCVISGTVTHNVTGVDAKLAPLGNYGGTTQTHALYITSPAIDAGNPGNPALVPDACAVTDQRGVARPIGFCDIGAFEGVWYPLYLPLILK